MFTGNLKCCGLIKTDLKDARVERLVLLPVGPFAG